MRKVLIANRGEIAVRIVRACRAAGLASVAVYSDADRRALHARLADEAYPIGPAAAADSYLNPAAILRAAREAGADALHPGYGFLSESPAFAEAVEQAGLVWIGPPPAAMRLLGDKIAARRLARSVGVPVVPGFDEEPCDDARLALEAERLGFPVLVKAAAGGGGRGMRLVESPADLPQAIASARREAHAAFGDDRLFLERYLVDVRHVEVQVLGDAAGQVVHLGERECSIQRRHQKVVEEAPSPVLGPEQRTALGEAAVRLARAAGYRNAGTVEFVVDDSGGFYFLEVNTRLQVEHPVTEAVTGLDLVQLQLALADGSPLPFRQDDLRLAGHAIECRIYAEDPFNRYLPSAGRLERFRPPEGPGLRNDVGVAPGDEVTVHYDPLLAKLIAHGQTRAEAVERALDGLRRYEIVGLQTNLPLLVAVLDHPDFRAGRTSTRFLEVHGLPARPVAPDPPPELLAALAAYELLRAGSAGRPAAGSRPGGDASPPGAFRSGPSNPAIDPWRAGPWRLARLAVPFRFRLGDRRSEVLASAEPGAPGLWRFLVDGRDLLAEIGPADGGAVLLRVGPRNHRVEVERRADGAYALRLGAATFVVWPEPPPDLESALPARSDGREHTSLKAPMPGRLVKVLVRAGDEVRPHQPLVVLEAMKIEHLVEAPAAGTVARVAYQEGDLVPLGATLVELEEA